MRVIVHAGFHKTGTTSLQAVLRENRAALAPHATIYLARQLGELTVAGRRYGMKPGPRRLKLFRQHLDSFLARVAEAPCIVISRESLSGKMPGDLRADGSLISSYADTAAPLAQCLVEGLSARFPSARIDLLYTTRGAEGFLRSSWKHNLRHRRLTEDYEGFRAAFTALPDLEAEVEALRRALPGTSVLSRALEELAPLPFGPAEAVLEMLDLPPETRAALHLPPAQRMGQSDGLSEEVLALNRSVLDDDSLRAQKQALLLEREGIRPD